MAQPETEGCDSGTTCGPSGLSVRSPATACRRRHILYQEMLGVMYAGRLPSQVTGVEHTAMLYRVWHAPRSAQILGPECTGFGFVIPVNATS